MNRFNEAWLNQWKQLFECQDKILGITKSKTKEENKTKEEKWQAAKLEEHEEADSYQQERGDVVELKTWRK